jgi:hypothetical protein
MMIRLHRHLERLKRAPKSAGISLVETMVVMLLSAIVMTIAGAMFVTVAKQTVISEDIRRSTADASNIMNVVSTTIRASVRNAVETSPVPDPAVVKATPTQLTIISYTDAGPSFETPLQLRYSISNGQMIEERWNPSIVHGYAVFPSVTTTPNARRILGNVVVNTAAEPLFRYYSAAGALLTPPASGLVLADRALVASVRFNVKVRALSSLEVVELDNTVGMPNMNLDTPGS